MEDKVNQALYALEDVKAERNQLRARLKELSEEASDLIVIAWNDGATVKEIDAASPFTHPWTSAVLSRAGILPGTRDRRRHDAGDAE